MFLTDRERVNDLFIMAIFLGSLLLLYLIRALAVVGFFFFFSRAPFDLHFHSIIFVRSMENRNVENIGWKCTPVAWFLHLMKNHGKICALFFSCCAVVAYFTM